MSNIFDQFDNTETQKETGNVFDQFSDSEDMVSPLGFSEEGKESVPYRAIKNLPSDSVQVVKEIGSMLLSPIETAKSLGDVGLGFIEKLQEGEQEHEKYADAVVQNLKETYGSVDGIKEYIAEQPAHALMDISAIITGGGAALRAGGKAAKLSKVATTGESLVKAGQAIDPLALGGKAIAKPVAKLAEKSKTPVAETVGMLTGTGPVAVREAMEGTGLTASKSPFLKGLRGVEEGGGALTDSRNALEIIKQKRASEYAAELEKIGQKTKSIDISPIKEKMNVLLKQYNIKIDPMTGDLDFSRATISKKGWNDVKDTFDDIRDWGKQKGDRTPIMVDNLKRRIGDRYGETAKSRAFISELRNETRKVIVDNVPEYATMTKKYSEMSGLIREIETSLSLGKKSGMETAIKKLLSVTKQNNKFKQELIQTLADVSGKENLLPVLSGIEMSPVIPRGFIGRGAGAGAIAGTASGMVNPWLLGIAASTSPRLMGEFLNMLGYSKNAANNIIKVATSQPARQAAYQTESKLLPETDKE